jgi:hypothetical protein
MMPRPGTRHSLIEICLRLVQPVGRAVQMRILS